MFDTCFSLDGDILMTEIMKFFNFPLWPTEIPRMEMNYGYCLALKIQGSLLSELSGPFVFGTVVCSSANYASNIFGE